MKYDPVTNHWGGDEADGDWLIVVTVFVLAVWMAWRNIVVVWPR